MVRVNRLHTAAGGAEAIEEGGRVGGGALIVAEDLGVPAGAGEGGEAALGLDEV